MLVLAVVANPVLAMLGQIAAIVICLFVLIFVLLGVAFNVLMAFAMKWVSEKINLIKMLRPSVESINSASRGLVPAAHEHAMVRRMASLPANLHAVDTKVEQSTHHVTKAVIEFRARTVQVQTVVKALLWPSAVRPRSTTPATHGIPEVKKPNWEAMGEPASQNMEKAV
jgi:predicted PurR-regulated permease PerM